MPILQKNRRPSREESIRLDGAVRHDKIGSHRIAIETIDEAYNWLS
jgi:hypothetical protein